MNIFDYLRVNFIGKPFELNKLIYDKNIIYFEEQEARNILKAYKKFYGFQYLGFISSFLICFILQKSKNITKFNFKKKIALFSISLTPMVVLYIYSHFVYWENIREDVIKLRKRSNLFKKEETKSMPETIIIFKTSDDIHKALEKQIGIFKCLKELI